MNYRSFPFIYARTRFLSRLPRTGKMLDVGCGPGEFEGLLKDIRPQWTFDGTDIERHPKLPKHVHFTKSDFNKKINCPSNTYDAVVCTHVFEHLQNTDKAIAEIYRILRPGGVLYIETPSERTVVLPSFGCVGKNQPVPINFYDDHTHIRPFSPHALARMSRGVGFAPLKAGYARNWLAVLTSPITFILAFLLQKRSFLVHSVWHVAGWASYAVVQKPK